MTSRPALVAAFVLATDMPLAATQRESMPVSFEVASVKENESGPNRNQTITPAGRFFAPRTTVLSLVAWAYDVPLFFQVVGGESWLRTAHFEVNAMLGPLEATQRNFKMAVQRLLQDRFNLVVSREVRELDTYDLVRIKPTEVHPALRRSDWNDCGVWNGTAPVPAPDAPRPLMCGMAIAPPARMTARVTSLDEFALLLSGQLGKSVNNRTGLAGKWDFDLNYIPPSASVSVDADGPRSLFTAVQEQLGLKLVSTRTGVELLVIKQASRPTPD